MLTALALLALPTAPPAPGFEEILAAANAKAAALEAFDATLVVRGEDGVATTLRTQRDGGRSNFTVAPERGEDRDLLRRGAHSGARLSEPALLGRDGGRAAPGAPRDTLTRAGSGSG